MGCSGVASLSRDAVVVSSLGVAVAAGCSRVAVWMVAVAGDLFGVAEVSSGGRLFCQESRLLG